MNTLALDTRTLSFPAEDIKLVKEIARKFGWSLSRKRKNGLDKGIDDIKAGRIKEVTDLDAYFRNL